MFCSQSETNNSDRPFLANPNMRCHVTILSKERTNGINCDAEAHKLPQYSIESVLTKSTSYLFAALRNIDGPRLLHPHLRSICQSLYFLFAHLPINCLSFLMKMFTFCPCFSALSSFSSVVTPSSSDSPPRSGNWGENLGTCLKST